ncbi:MAG: hypothetical protein E6G64_07445 [Actinobacteria bacterium]|nr:MAG: hypothetical protein E6G64_07445 [Actinomycetota bacterium]
MAPSSRTKPWSRTRIASSAITLSVVAMLGPSLEPLPEGIAERYGIAIPTVGERLAGGSTGSLLRAGSVVVRAEHADPQNVRWEHELLFFLAEESEAVIAPLLQRDGSSFFLDGDRVVSVFPFVDGESLKLGDKSLRRTWPTLIGRLHRRAQAWPVQTPRPGVPGFRDRDWEHNDWWDWDAVEKAPALIRAYEELREWVAHAPPLTVWAIHGDLHPANVLTRDGRIAGIIDWHYARRDWPAFELACVAWDVSRRPNTIVLDDVVMERAVTDYIAAGGPGEPEHLRTLMRLRALAALLFSLTRAARGLSSNPAFINMLLPALDAFA